MLSKSKWLDEFFRAYHQRSENQPGRRIGTKENTWHCPVFPRAPTGGVSPIRIGSEGIARGFLGISGVWRLAPAGIGV